MKYESVSLTPIQTTETMQPSNEVATHVPPPPRSRSRLPGFRFYPTDEELVTYYLRRKVRGKPFWSNVVSEIDVYKSEPWELSEFSSGDQEWYFLSPFAKKYGYGSRLNRATVEGYWKSTGKDRPVYHKNEVIGMKKILVFYIGRAPNGKRTDWVMHEYRLLDEGLQKVGVSQDGFVLCKIFYKNGVVPPNGDRYAPSIKEEGEMFTSDDEILDGAKNVEKDIREEKLELCLYDNEHKRSKSEDPSSSKDLSHEKKLKSVSSKLEELPLLYNKPTLFDSSSLEEDAPNGYWMSVRKLEDEILSVSGERDTLKLEVMRALSQIDDLESKVALMIKENEDLKRIGRSG